MAVTWSSLAQGWQALTRLTLAHSVLSGAIVQPAVDVQDLVAPAPTGSADVTLEQADCSLNGEYTVVSDAGGSSASSAGGVGGCVCDAPWTGQDCSLLDVGSGHGSAITYPTEPQTTAGGDNTYNAAAWGGTIARDDGGVYHLFTDVVCQDWSPGFHELNANIEHSVSHSPLGPWRSKGVVVGAAKGLTSINPRIQRAPDGTYLLFHIAISSSNFHNSALPTNCTVSPARRHSTVDAD
jgi:hypothetical protein